MSDQPHSHSRLIAVSILGVVVALATFSVLLTVRYRNGLEQRLRQELTAGASTLRAAGTSAALKPVIGSLAAQGISVDLAGITAPGGTVQFAARELLTARVAITVDGRRVLATLAGSRIGINRQVRSLEVTEAIGGVIVLALLAALARVLVLLDRAALEARASEAAMRTFLADASHELRTPVAALQATAERLLREQPGRPARDAIEADLARDSGRLGRLIDDLLNLARLDAREQPDRQLVDLAEIASEAVTAARAAHPSAHLRLIAGGGVPANADRDALGRAIRNLLANALAVADTVVIEVTATPHGSTLVVTDNGPGIPADQRERIFDPFVRLAAGPRGGTGLGLAIVRRTIEAHGGTTTCDPAPDGGSRFTLRLPTDGSPAPQSAVGAAAPRISSRRIG